MGFSLPKKKYKNKIVIVYFFLLPTTDKKLMPKIKSASKGLSYITGNTVSQLLLVVQV